MIAEYHAEYVAGGNDILAGQGNGFGFVLPLRDGPGEFTGIQDANGHVGSDPAKKLLAVPGNNPPVSAAIALDAVTSSIDPHLEADPAMRIVDWIVGNVGRKFQNRCHKYSPLDQIIPPCDQKEQKFLAETSSSCSRIGGQKDCNMRSILVNPFAYILS